MASDIVSILLAGWSDSEFAVAASGEFGEDLKAKIEGELARKADRIEALEAALREIRDCTEKHGGPATALKIIRQALEGSGNG